VRRFWWRGVYSGLIGILVDMYIIAHSLIHTYTYVCVFISMGGAVLVGDVYLGLIDIMVDVHVYAHTMCTHTRLYIHIRLYTCT